MNDELIERLLAAANQPDLPQLTGEELMAYLRQLVEPQP